MPTFETEPRAPFGELLLEEEVPTDISLKEPIIIRILRLLKSEGCVGNDEAEMVQLCIDEALKNAMLHGNQFKTDKSVAISIFADDEQWGILIEDEGEGMTPDKVPEPILGEEARESGYGIILMESTMKEVVFMGRGNQLLLIRDRTANPISDVSEVVVPSDEELAESDYVAPAGSDPTVPDSLDFDLDAPVEFEQKAEKQEVTATPGVAIDGAELESESPTLRVHRKDGFRILELTEKQISDFNLTQVREDLVAASEGESVVILDMRNVIFISSVVLGALVNLYKELNANGQTIRLTSLCDTLQEVFKITKLDTIFSIFTRVDDAINAPE